MKKKKKTLYKTVRMAEDGYRGLQKLKKILNCDTLIEVIRKLTSGKILFVATTTEGSKIFSDLPLARGASIQLAATQDNAEVLWPQVYIELGTDDGK